MKPKHKPKYMVLTDHNISIGEFKNKRDLQNFLKQYNDENRPVRKIVSSRDFKKTIYLPLF